MALFKIPQKSKVEKLAKLTAEQRDELFHIQEGAIANFRGAPEELESALGLLAIGHHFGWKPLYLIHSKATIRKYEKILGIKIREVFPPIGPSAYRSLHYRLAEAANNFWKVVSGESNEVKIERKDRRIE